MGVCYESAQTRKFKEGRTEVIRSSSQEAKDWIESMVREGENVSLLDLLSFVASSQSN